MFLILCVQIFFVASSVCGLQAPSFSSISCKCLEAQKACVRHHSGCTCNVLVNSTFFLLGRCLVC